MEPIVHELELPVAAAPAFEAFVTRIGTWWDPRYTRDPATLRDVVIEPRVGGRWYARHADGDDDWGVVKVFEPGRRLVSSFSLAQPTPSEVAAIFTDGQLRFEHGGFADPAVRARFSDWPKILARFVSSL